MTKALQQSSTTQNNLDDTLVSISFLFHWDIQIDWAVNIRKSWDFSEEGAHARLESFLHDGDTLCKLHLEHY